MKKLLIFSLVVALGGGGGWYALAPGEEGVQFATVPLERQDMVSTVTATGRIEAVSVVAVGTQVSGTIMAISVDFNDRVHRGQVIALLDPSILQSQVEQQEANLSLAQAGVARASATVADAERTFHRQKELFSRRLIAQSEVDAAETTLLTARAGRQEAQAKVAQARASLKQARENLGYARIISPTDGTVIDRKVDVGQTVAASFQTPTLFSIAEDLTRMQIEAHVDEADIGRVTEGQDVEFRVDAHPGKLFRGTVTQVRLAPAVTENVVTYTTVIRVDNEELLLKPGMTATVTIITERRPQVLRVPAAALRFAPPEAPSSSASGAMPGMGPTFPRRPNGGRHGAGRSGPRIWVLSEDAPWPVAVVPGISDGSFVEILSGDLREGQPIITSATKVPGTSRWQRLLASGGGP